MNKLLASLKRKGLEEYFNHPLDKFTIDQYLEKAVEMETEAKGILRGTIHNSVFSAELAFEYSHKFMQAAEVMEVLLAPA